MQLILIPGVDILGWRALAGARTAFGATFYYRLQKWETTHAQRKKHVINLTVKARALGADHKDRSSGTRISAVRFLIKQKELSRKTWR